MEVKFVKEYVQARLENLKFVQERDELKAETSALKEFYTEQATRSAFAISELEGVLNLLEQC